MKAFKFFLALIMVLFFGCESEITVQEESGFIKPPAQKGEIDLVGFSDQLLEAVAVNPKEPWNIIVSTGTPNTRVFISRDYGISWNVTLDSIRSRCIVWDNKNSSIAYLAKNIKANPPDIFTSPFILKTNDYGKSWIKSDSGIYLMDKHITSISLDYFNSDYIYLAATANKYAIPSNLISSKGITYISSNGGKSFSNSIALSLYNSLGDVFVQDLVTSNLRNGLIYAAIIADNNDYDLAISSDFGNSWVAKNIVDNWYSDFIKMFNETILLKVIDKQIPNKYFMRTSSRLLISNDFGMTFKMIDQSDLDYSNINDFLLTPDGHIIISAYLASNPLKCVLYLSKDKGKSWTTLTSDTDSKTLLNYDSKNKFLYFVKDKENKGLYRIKLQ